MSLTLNIETKDYNMKIGVKNVSIIYRVCFKVLTILAPKAKKFDIKRKTTLFETNISKSFVSISKTLIWSEIRLPEILEKNRNVKQIIETADGR